MRWFDPATTAYLARRGGALAHLMAYFWAANRATGAVEALGLWTGPEDVTVAIDGEDRTFLRIGALMACDEILAQVGHDVVTTRLSLSAIDAQVLLALRGYDLRLAPAELYRMLCDPVTEAPIAPPHRLVRGWVDRAPLPTAEAGGEVQPVAIDIASAARSLTLPLPAVASEGAHAAARQGDRFRRYQDPSGSVPVVWGGRRF